MAACCRKWTKIAFKPTPCCLCPVVAFSEIMGNCGLTQQLFSRTTNFGSTPKLSSTFLLWFALDCKTKVQHFTNQNKKEDTLSFGSLYHLCPWSCKTLQYSSIFGEGNLGKLIPQWHPKRYALSHIHYSPLNACIDRRGVSDTSIIATELLNHLLLPCNCAVEWHDYLAR